MKTRDEAHDQVRDLDSAIKATERAIAHVERAGARASGIEIDGSILSRLAALRDSLREEVGIARRYL